MDWFQLGLWIFAIIGVVAVVLIIIITILVLVYDKPEYTSREYPPEYREIDMRGGGGYASIASIREQVYNSMSGNSYKEPTLKGRVDMIEKHLGIHVEVKPFQEAKLVIKKGK